MSDTPPKTTGNLPGLTPEQTHEELLAADPLRDYFVWCAYFVYERRTERIDLRANAAEIAALDFLLLRWNATRSDVIRSLVVGAALAQLDRLDEALVANRASMRS